MHYFKLYNRLTCYMPIGCKSYSLLIFFLLTCFKHVFHSFFPVSHSRTANKIFYYKWVLGYRWSVFWVYIFWNEITLIYRRFTIFKLRTLISSCRSNNVVNNCQQKSVQNNGVITFHLSILDNYHFRTHLGIPNCSG